MSAAGPEEDADNSVKECSSDANFIIVGKKPTNRLKFNKNKTKVFDKLKNGLILNEIINEVIGVSPKSNAMIV